MVEVAPAAVVLLALPVVDEPESFAHVFGPTTPSTVSPLFFWNARTAVSVCGPNLPSTVTLYPACFSAVWICSTPLPVSPSFTLSLGEVTTRPFTVVVVVAPLDDDAVVLAAVVVVAAAVLAWVMTGGAAVVVGIGVIPPTAGVVVVVVAVFDLLLGLALLLQAPSQRAPRAHAISGIRCLTMWQD